MNNYERQQMAVPHRVARVAPRLKIELWGGMINVIGFHLPRTEVEDEIMI